MQRRHGLRLERRREAALPPVLRAQRPRRRSTRRAAYYTAAPAAHALGAQRAQGPRSSYVGSEVFLSLVDADEGPYRSSLRQLAVETLCTNRDLPLHIPLGQDAPTSPSSRARRSRSIRCMAGPTPPRPSHAHGDVAGGSSAISRSTTCRSPTASDGRGQGAAALRELLSLYADLGDAAQRKQIEGVRSTAAAGITRALPVAGAHRPSGAASRSTVTCDETAFEGSGRVPPRRGAGAVLRQVRVDQLLHRDRAAHHSARRGHAMAGESGLRQVLDRPPMAAASGDDLALQVSPEGGELASPTTRPRSA